MVNAYTIAREHAGNAISMLSSEHFCMRLGLRRHRKYSHLNGTSVEQPGSLNASLDLQKNGLLSPVQVIYVHPPQPHKEAQRIIFAVK